ncbi:hypothetical protein ACQP1U_17245 [Actinomycetota bacterium]
MGFNCAVVVIPGATMGDLTAAGAELTGETVTGDVALTSANDGAAAMQVGDALVLASGDVMALPPADECASRLGKTAYAAVLSSVADTYVWEVRGPAADRQWVVSYGETQADQGAPLPEEAQIGQLDEDGLIDLLAATTGVSVGEVIDAQGRLFVLGER